MATDLQIIFNDILSDASSLQDLCRLCGNYNMSMFSIFDNTSQYDFLKIINLHFRSFSIIKTDVLPLKICFGCVTSLTSWHEFYTKCLDVNKRFETIREKLSSIMSANKLKNEAVIQDNLPLIDLKLKRSTSDISIHDQVDNVEDIPDIEVIEIKVNGDESMENEDEYDDSSYTEEVYDIANIHMHDDLPKLQISETTDEIDNRITDDSIQEEKHKTEELTTENDLNIQNDPLVCVVENSVSSQTKTNKSKEKCKLSPKRCSKNCCRDEKSKKICSFRHRLRICHLCGKHYYTDSGFRHHMVMHRDPSFSCHLCGRVFYESQNLKKHLAAIHSEERPFQCHMCGTKYKRRDVLQEHIKRVHDGVKRPWNPQLLEKYRSSTKMTIKGRYQCPHCNKCLASKNYLNDHINGVHIKKEIYKCDQCSMAFTRKASFRYHFKRAHILKKKVLEPRGTFLKDCEYCGLQFQIKKYYEIHVASKHFNKYPCEHCEDVFDNKFHLTKHTESEHADQISKCESCGKSFSEDTHLKRHIYLCHTIRNPYECHNCGYKANKKSTLEVHMRRHTGEKPYQCDMCIKRFAQSVDYRKHRANHFKQKAEDRTLESKTGIQYIIKQDGVVIEADYANKEEDLSFETITSDIHIV